MVVKQNHCQPECSAIDIEDALRQAEKFKHLSVTYCIRCVALNTIPLELSGFFKYTLNIITFFFLLFNKINYIIILKFREILKNSISKNTFNIFFNTMYPWYQLKQGCNGTTPIKRPPKNKKIHIITKLIIIGSFITHPDTRNREKIDNAVSPCNYIRFVVSNFFGDFQK